MIGHVGGAPIEELLPLVASGGATMVVALRAALGRLARRRRAGRSRRAAAPAPTSTLR